MTPPSPYRGFLPFRYADRRWFFGRTREIQELTAKAVLYRLVLLFGGSGAGKSSLLNAGLCPALRKEGFQPERLRLRPVEDEPILVERIEAPEEPSGFLPSIFDTAGNTSTEIFCSITEFTHGIDRTASVTGAVPVLIFDQFEEVFTVIEPVSRRLRDRLLRTIVELVNSPGLKAKIILALREDFLGHLEVISRGLPQVFDRRIRLRQMEREAAEAAIRGSFQQPAGNPWQAEITDDTADAILADFLAGDPNATVHTTHLQIVCRRLWDSFAAQGPITPGHYRSAGGVKGLLEGFLESELAQLPAADRARAYRLLGQLVTGSGTRDIVSEVRLREQLETDATLTQWFKPVSRFLEQRHLINRIQQSGTYYVEIASEYLIAPVARVNEEAARRAAAAEAAEEAARLAIEQARETARERELEQTRLRAAAQAKTTRVLFSFTLGLLLLLAVAVYLLVKGNRLQNELTKVNTNRGQLVDELNRRAAELGRKNTDLDQKTKQLDEYNRKLKKQTNIAERVSAWLAEQKAQSERLRRIENSSRLALQADSTRGWDAQLSARLALEALLHDHSPQADSAVRRSLGALQAERRQAATTSSGAFCPDGECVMFSLPGQVSLNFRTARGKGPSFVFSPDGRYSALAAARAVMVWEAPVGRQVAAFETQGEVRELRFSADGASLGTLEGSQLAVRNTLSGQIQNLVPLFSPVRLLALSTGGRYATVEAELSRKLTELQVWDVVYSVPVLRIESDNAGPVFATSPDGRKVFVGAKEAGVVWDAWAGKPVFRAAPLRTPLAAAFAPDNRFLAVWGADREVAVWDLSTGSQVLSLTTSASPAAGSKPAVAFSPNGQFLAVTAGQATEMYLYRTADLARELCSALDRSLSRWEWSHYLHEDYRDSCAQFR